jgi:hypothetical protein
MNFTINLSGATDTTVASNTPPGSPGGGGGGGGNDGPEAPEVVPAAGANIFGLTPSYMESVNIIDL